MEDFIDNVFYWTLHLIIPFIIIMIAFFVGYWNGENNLWWLQAIESFILLFIMFFALNPKNRD